MDIISLMKKLGYTVKTDGMCYGLAFMAIQAIIREDIMGYHKRLKLINSYDQKLDEYHVSNNISDIDGPGKVIYISRARRYKYQYLGEDIVGTIPVGINVNTTRRSPNLFNKDLKNHLSVDLLVHEIEKSEKVRASRKPKHYNCFHQDLCDIKSWLDGVVMYVGPIEPKGIDKQERIAWGNNFRTRAGKNPPLHIQNWRRPNTIFSIEEGHRHINPRDRPIFSQRKWLYICNDVMMQNLIDSINHSQNPIAYTLSDGGHVIAVGGSKTMKCHLIDHDNYKIHPRVEDIAWAFGQSVTYNSSCWTSLMCCFAPKVRSSNILSVEQFGIANVPQVGHAYFSPACIRDLQVRNFWGCSLLHMALRDGHAEAIKVYIEEILSSNAAIDKQMLLEAKTDDGGPGLYVALQNGHTKAIRVYIEAILHSNARGIDKQMLLEAKTDNGTPGLYMALENGHTDAIRVYVILILHSNAMGIDKQVLLEAKSNGVPGLYIALQNGHTEAIMVYIVAILDSHERGIDKQMLLEAKTDNGTPGLCIALQIGHAEAVRVYVIEILSSNAAIDKQILLEAKRNNCTSGLCMASHSGNAEAIKVYVEEIRRSNAAINKRRLLPHISMAPY